MTHGFESAPRSEAQESPETHLDRLVRSLLFEGYALYPYTSASTKNATPTPFGIVYPGAYAERQTHAYDRMQFQGIITDAAAPVTGEVLFLQTVGDRHEAVDRRVELPEAPCSVDFEFDGVCGRATLDLDVLPAPLDGAADVPVAPRARVTLKVENTTPLTEEEAEQDRKDVMARCLMSTHLVARVDGARFLSPLERGDDGVAGCCNVNTWPVLATPDDDVLLGPTIMLPEHPQIAPESVVDFFDGTEIEEALVLHIQALSDAEREEIAQGDPKIKEMLARADATTPEQLMDMHGRVRLEDPPGEREATIAGVVVHRGDKVVLRPDADRDIYDKLVHGKIATIHRFFIDDEQRTHVGVTIDDDPMAEILGESSRFLFFFPHELEVV